MGEDRNVSPAAKRPRGALLKWAAFTLVAGLLAIAGCALYVWDRLGEWLRQQVVDAARQQGVVLELPNLEFSLSGVHLRDARAKLEGVTELTAYLQSVDIAVSGFKPNHIDVDGILVQAVGSPLSLGNAVRAWQARHPTVLSAMPKTNVGKTRFTWQEASNSSPFVVLDGVAVGKVAKPYGPVGDDACIEAERAEVGAYAMAPLVAVIHVEPQSVEVGLGAKQWEGVSARGGWKSQPNANELHLSFGPLKLGSLLAQSPVAVKDATLTAASLAGGVSLLIPNDAHRSYAGQWAFDVAGWTPPHPPELQGFAFGNSTRLQSSFEVDRALTLANFSDVRLLAGEFKLVGRAVARRNTLTSALVQAELKGRIPCAALASAVATSKLGQAYGRWVASHAEQLVQGYVEATVQIDADTNNLQRAKLVKQIGVGCGLKPLSISEVLSLGLPPPPDADLLRHLGKDLADLSHTLPPLPSLKIPDLQPPNWMKHRGH
jgi:hypothetical protein